MMIFGSLLLILVHLTLSLTRVTPYIPMFLLGMAFSLIPATMWPSVAKIVDESRLGTAYGLMFSIQNIGLWAFPILIGTVLDRSNPGVTPELIAKGEAAYNYTNPILMLAALGIFGLVFAFLLKREDRTSGYGLESPNKSKPA
jgi:MFS family permease